MTNFVVRVSDPADIASTNRGLVIEGRSSRGELVTLYIFAGENPGEFDLDLRSRIFTQLGIESIVVAKEAYNATA